MSPRERQIQRVAWAVIVLAVAVYVVRLIPRGPNFAELCTRVADAHTWERNYQGYFWETNHSVIAVSATQTGFMRLDLTTGAPTYLTTFSQRVTQAQPDLTDWRLSPDGEWFLIRRPGVNRVEAFSLDSDKMQSWPISGRAMQYVHWMPDSNAWVELRRTPADQVVPVVHHLAGGYRQAQTIKGPCNFPISTTADSRLITAEDRGDHVDVIRYDLTPQGSAPLTATLSFETGFGGFEAEASHKGDRIAFLTHTRVRPPAMSILGFLFPALKDSGDRTTVWLANTDGTGLHKVGVQRNQPVAGLQWTPDDTHLSCFIGGSLYTIAAR